MRILITGASGSGTTTLGHAFARELKIACFDSDDYFWLPTEPPYQERRDPTARLSLLLADLAKSQHSVISGSVMGWGRELEDCFSLVVFLVLDAELRVARLRERETARFGRADAEFLAWAAQYEEGRMEGRSRALHERWLSERSCPILHIEGDLSVREKVRRVSQALSDLNLQPPGATKVAIRPGPSPAGGG